jgi:hypothetical protein
VEGERAGKHESAVASDRVPPVVAKVHASCDKGNSLKRARKAVCSKPSRAAVAGSR